MKCERRSAQSDCDDHPAQRVRHEQSLVNGSSAQYRDGTECTTAPARLRDGSRGAVAIQRSAAWVIQVARAVAAVVGAQGGTRFLRRCYTGGRRSIWPPCRTEHPPHDRMDTRSHSQSGGSLRAECGAPYESVHGIRRTTMTNARAVLGHVN
jgi:hypothetical protein